jgi:hypothetical protein
VPREVERGDQPEVEAEVVVVEGLAGPNRGSEIGWFQSGMLGNRNAGTRKLSLRLLCLLAVLLLDLYYLYDRIVPFDWDVDMD